MTKLSPVLHSADPDAEEWAILRNAIDVDEEERFNQRRRMAPVARRTPHLQKVQRSTLRALRESKLCSKKEGVVISGCRTGAYGRTQIRSRTLLR